jgi:hypothetical protein
MTIKLTLGQTACSTEQTTQLQEDPLGTTHRLTVEKQHAHVRMCVCIIQCSTLNL